MKYINYVKCELYTAAIAYSITSNGKLQYLLAKRFKDSKAHLPRGKIEAKDESIDAGIIRELKKEVKIKGLILPGLEYMIKKRVNEETKKCIIYTVFETRGEKPRPDKKEIERAWWASLDEAVNQLGKRYEVAILKDVDSLLYRHFRELNQVPKQE